MAEVASSIICDGCPAVAECLKASGLLQEFNGVPVSDPGAILVSAWQESGSAAVMRSWDCRRDGCKLIVGAYATAALTARGQAKAAVFDAIGVVLQEKPATADEV